MNGGRASRSTRRVRSVYRKHCGGHAADECSVVEISTEIVNMPAMANASSYVASKLAGTKIWEIIGKEKGNLNVVHVHLSVIYSELNVISSTAAVNNGELYQPLAENIRGQQVANLAGGFIVWICSLVAAWLRIGGKYSWVNWDVLELWAMDDKLFTA